MRLFIFLLIFAETTATSNSSDTSAVSTVVKRSSIQCHLVEINGYLKEECGRNEYGRIQYKCPHSDQFYFANGGGASDCRELSFDDVCPNDPGFYEACGHGGCAGTKNISGNILLCETYVHLLHEILELCWIISDAKSTVL